MKEIYVDENGYNQFFDELEKLKRESLLISSVGSEEYESAIGDGWHDNFAFEEIIRESRKIATRIEEMQKAKQFLKIIGNKKTKNNIININDILKIEICYSDDDIEKITIKLTGNYLPNTNTDEKIQEITLNSPLGKALYLRNINDDSINYEVNNHKIKINILGKINNKEQ